MTTLSAHTTRAIHNKGMQAVYGIAAEYDVDVADVIALLGTTSHTPVLDRKPVDAIGNSDVITSKPNISGGDSVLDRDLIITPSQPLQASSHAPVADPSIAPTVDVKAEVSSPLISADPIHHRLVHDGEQAPAGPNSTQAAPTSLPGAECADDRAPIPPETVTSGEAAQAAAVGESPAIQAAEDIGAQPHGGENVAIESAHAAAEEGAPIASAAPPSKPRPQQAEIDRDAATVLQAHISNPDWTARMIARGLNFSWQRVVMLARTAGVTLPTQVEYDAAQGAKIAEKLKQAPSAHLAPPPPLVATTLPVQSKTIKQRVREVHAEYPEWSSRQIASALPDANAQTISVALSDLRGEERAAQDIITQTRLIAEADQRRNAPRKAQTHGPSLQERVQALHRQQPTWTARLIANELGAPLNSVRTMLSTARAETPNPPEFADTAALHDHYAQVGKRLGKPT